MRISDRSDRRRIDCGERRPMIAVTGASTNLSDNHRAQRHHIDNRYRKIFPTDSVFPSAIAGVGSRMHGNHELAPDDQHARGAGRQGRPIRIQFPAWA